MANTPSNYPDWVLKYKRTGTYINKVGDKYYLYAAHSERVKETGKIKRVCDGYLGRITEKDGFIPVKDKLLDAAIKTYELGFSYTVIASTSNIHSGLRKSFVKNGDLIYACSVLNYVFGFHSSSLYLASWLSLCFPDVVYPLSFTNEQLRGIERGTRMITDTMAKLFGDDLIMIKALFSTVSLLSVNGKLYLPAFSDDILTLSDKYSIDWRNTLWQR